MDGQEQSGYSRDGRLKYENGHFVMYLSRATTFSTMLYVHRAKTHISLYID